jgi:hypothetical protein
MHLARRIGAALALVFAALALFAAPGYASGSKAIWGPPTLNGVSQFPLYHTLGTGIYETDLGWSQTASTRPKHPLDPSDPAYHWPSSLSYEIQKASVYHMRVLIMVNETPDWANGGRAANWVPSRVSDLANFLTAAAHKYPSVHLWMVWGEPSRRPNFEPLTPASPKEGRLTRAQAAAPHKYARMLDAGYGALKAVSKKNLVIGGNTYTTGDIDTRQWIENLKLPNGKPPRMDLYGHNPFSFRAPNLSDPPSPDGEVDFSDLKRLSGLVNHYLAPPHHQLRLFLSEWTIPTAPDDEFNIYVTPAVQAEWIADAWRIVRHNHFIYALGWIHVYDDPPGGSAGGLLDAQGTPKPGYYAWKAG